MSDMSQGPGWWQAADGKWYPPEQRPGGASPTPPGDTAVDAKGFIASLYDFSFESFVTPKLIRFFYALFVIVLSIGAAFLFLGALASGEGAAIFGAIIFIPLLYLVYLVLTRIYFELVAALFRIADDLRAIRQSKGV